MIIVALTMSAVAITVIAGLALSGAVTNRVAKSERDQENKYIVDGAIQLATADLATGALAAGQSKVYRVGGHDVTVAAVDNSFNLANTARLVVTGAGKGGATLQTSQLVATKVGSIDNIWSYAFCSNTNFSFVSGANRVNGSVFFRNSPSLLGGSVLITQDLKTCSLLTPPPFLTIQGALRTGVAPLSFPSVKMSDYTPVAAVVLNGNQVLNGYTFPSPNAVIVVNGNLDLKGAIMGSGTIFVKGNVDVTGSVSRPSPAAHFLVVSPQNVTIRGSGSMNVDGYYFSGGQLTIKNPMTGVGAFAAQSYNVQATFSTSWDPWLTKDPANGKALHAPVMFP